MTDMSQAMQERQEHALMLLSKVASGMAGIEEARELAAHLGLSNEFNQCRPMAAERNLYAMEG